MTEFGVYVGNKQGALARFESWLGHPVDTVLGYTGNRSWDDANPSWAISSGLLGVPEKQVNWSIPMYPEGGGVTALREVAAGQHNSQYTNWAQQILAARAGDDGPIYVRTSWELGGEWFSWTADAQADPAAYRAAYGQFAQSFHAVSSRFQMVWDVSGDRGPVEQWYPGDKAVDVISQDVYWNPQWTGRDPTAAFAYSETGMDHGLAWMAEFAAAHGKAVAIPEWGVPGATGNTLDNATFIHLMRGWIDSHNVVFANYWDGELNSGYDGKLSDGSDPLAEAAYRREFSVPAPVVEPVPPSPATYPVVGSGPDSLVLKVSQDAWQGDAHYTVMVDGKPVGGTQTAHASHAASEEDTLTLHGTWGPGDHQVSLAFLDDAYGGTAATDRNLYLDAASFNGVDVPQAPHSLLSAGSVGFLVHGAATVASGAAVQFGVGSDTLALRLSQDAWQGDAQYTIMVDGKQLGGTQTAHAVHSSGAEDVVLVSGDWGPGQHQVAVNFLNDAYGGTAVTDRNLYLDGANFDGRPVAGSHASLMSTGAAGFMVTDTTPLPGSTSSIGTGGDVIALRVSQDAYQGDAQYTVSVDGQQVGGTQTAHAAHVEGAFDLLAVHGDWAEGSHALKVTFLNDAYAGSAATDRNLYVEGASYNGLAGSEGMQALYAAGSVHLIMLDLDGTSGGTGLGFA